MAHREGRIAKVAGRRYERSKYVRGCAKEVRHECAPYGLPQASAGVAGFVMGETRPRICGGKRSSGPFSGPNARARLRGPRRDFQEVRRPDGLITEHEVLKVLVERR